MPVTVILRVSCASSPKTGNPGKEIEINTKTIFENFTNKFINNVSIYLYIENIKSTNKSK